MIQIDELSNEVLTDMEISNRVSALIESAYPAGREMKIMRSYLASPTDVVAKAAFDEYNAAVELIRADGVAARLKAALVRAAIEYEVAIERLAHPVLSEPAMIEVTNDTGVLVTIPNVQKEKDTAERAQAAEVIYLVSADALLVVNARIAARPAIVVEPVPDQTLPV
jgi:hypothetical protein